MDFELEKQRLDQAIDRGEIEEYILPLVQALWQIGIPTASSCHGHTRSEHQPSSPHPFVYLGFWNSHKELPAEMLHKLVILLGLWNGGSEPSLIKRHGFVIKRTEWILSPRFVITTNGQYLTLHLQPEDANPEGDANTLVWLRLSAVNLADFLVKSSREIKDSCS